MTPTFSIIIPTYNAATTLACTLDSLAKQDFENFEVIIIDAVSTDDTLTIAEHYAKKLPIRIFSEPDKGIYRRYE